LKTGAARNNDPKYEVTGDLSPDVTGTYEAAGPYEGKPSYEIVSTGWYIWWEPEGNWTISRERGVVEDDWWIHIHPDIEGAYTAHGGATGEATVTVIP